MYFPRISYAIFFHRFRLVIEKPSSKAIDDASAGRSTRTRDSCFCWTSCLSNTNGPVRLILLEVFTSHGHGEITIRSRNVAITVILGVYSSQLTRCQASWKVRCAHAPVSFSFTASRNSFLQKCCAAALVRAR